MKTKVTRRHQITIPKEIRKKAKISAGDNLEISYEHGKILIEKIDENWENVMKETKGAWRKHPIFKDMDDAVEIVNRMRGKAR
ncbi:Antidote-toxin recognition MazE, bacterial antitoxin [uncultured archaeon]|nr:Antidote-toxin recognition MazE, bacterial antitoxin [uncultured archaeon]